MASVTLRKTRETRVRSGHPWIYASEIDRVDGGFENGDIVDVKDFRGKFIGRGFYNPHSQISLRILTRNDEPCDRAFFERRICDAWAYRQRLCDPESCRLIYSESDFLPGLVVDKFANTLVMQSLSLGIDRIKDMLCDLLMEIVQPDGIYERSDVPVRRLEGMELTTGLLRGAVPERVDMVENGILENPRVDAAFGEHIMSCFPKETVLYGTGSMSTGADLFTITVHGKGGHGSVPHTTIDPINIACHIVLNLQTVNSREVDAKEMAAVNTDARVTELTGNEIKKHMDLEKVNDHTLKLPFSEDFSYISERVPSAFFLIGACPEKGEVLTQHNPRIIFDEESMKTGVLVYVAGAVGYLKQGKEETI